MNKTKQWFLTISNGQTIRAAALDISVDPATLNRQINGERLAPDNVVKLAHLYHANILEGFKVIGLIDEADIRSIQTQTALSEATDEEIAQEIWKRLVNSPNTPHPAFQNPEPTPTVNPLHLAAHDPGDDYMEESDHLYD